MSLLLFVTAVSDIRHFLVYWNLDIFMPICWNVSQVF